MSPIVVWAGRTWVARTLPPTAANTVARLASAASSENGPLAVAVDVLLEGGVDVGEVVDHLSTCDIDDVDILELVGEVLEVGTARPWRSTVGLCRTTVTQWSTIRGRLIDKGIPDPLRALPSLTALLDVVEVMILDSMEKKEDREKFIRDLYRRSNTTSGPPPGWQEGADLSSIL